MSFLDEITKALQRPEGLERDFPESHISFLKDLLALKTPREFEVLCTRYKFNDEELDKIKMNIDKLFEFATKNQEWLSKVSGIDAVRGESESYV